VEHREPEQAPAAFDSGRMCFGNIGESTFSYEQNIAP